MENIYLAISDNREIDMQSNTAMALEYVAYQLSRQIEAATQTAGARVCKQQHKTAHLFRSSQDY